MDMSELKARYGEKSPEMFHESAPDTPPSKKKVDPVDALRQRIMNNPDVQRLRKFQVNSFNAGEVKEQIKKIRQYLFRELTKLKQHDMTPEELDFAEQVLGLRIDNGQVAEMRDRLHEDSYRDFDQLFYDVRMARKGVETNKHYLERYPNSGIATSMPSAEQYLRLDRDQSNEVPEVDLEDVEE